MNKFQQRARALRMHLLIFSIAVVLPLKATAKEELALGSEHAPVTLIEFGSLACDYCIRFHHEVLPQISSQYIETGLVRFVFRNFPTSENAHRGAIAARCAGGQYYEMLDTLFMKVGQWLYSSDVDAALVDQATSIGLNEKPFLNCLNDTNQYIAVSKEQLDAKSRYSVLGTPSFLINSKLVRGKKSYAEMEILLNEALSSVRDEKSK